MEFGEGPPRPRGPAAMLHAHPAALCRALLLPGAAAPAHGAHAAPGYLYIPPHGASVRQLY